METLDFTTAADAELAELLVILDFTTATDAELAELLVMAGMTVPKKIKRDEMILRLKLRILVDPGHARAIKAAVLDPYIKQGPHDSTETFTRWSARAPRGTPLAIVYSVIQYLRMMPLAGPKI